jgi:hypothetical protein
MNKINTIETGTFYNLPELKFIGLDYNSDCILKLKIGSFNCLKNLTGINIAILPIMNIEEAAFNDIPNFGELSNGLSLLPNKRMEGPLCQYFMRWSHICFGSGKSKRYINREFYQVNVNELIVYAYVRVLANPLHQNTTQSQLQLEYFLFKIIKSL